MLGTLKLTPRFALAVLPGEQPNLSRRAAFECLQTLACQWVPSWQRSSEFQLIDSHR
jgi:hypothetical protein